MNNEHGILEVSGSGVTESGTEPRRKRGEGRIWRRGRIYWIQFYGGAEQIRESSHSRNRDVAERLLRQRIAEADAGLLLPPRASRVSYEELRDALGTLTRHLPLRLIVGNGSSFLQLLSATAGAARNATKWQESFLPACWPHAQFS